MGMQHAIEYVDPAALKPAPWNPRRISKGALKRLAGLLDAHGFVDPVIARREDRLIVGGHQRIRANSLRSRPDERVPVVFLEGLSDEQAKALNIALNNPHAQGEYDEEILADLLAEIELGDFDAPAVTGFSETEIAAIVGPGDQPAGPEPAEAVVPECYQVVAECRDEGRQRELYERLTGEGYQCRLLVL